MNAYRQRQLGGLNYQLQYYQGLQQRGLQELDQQNALQNEKQLQDIIRSTGKKGILSTLGTGLTSVGGPLALKGATTLGKNLFNRFKSANAPEEDTPTGLSDTQYDKDLESTMADIEKTNPEPESNELADADEGFDYENFPETDLTGFADPSFEGKLSTFTPEEDFPEEEGVGASDTFEAPVEGMDIAQFQPRTFTFGGQTMDEIESDLRSGIESGEIEPTDLEATPELNPVQRFFSNLIFGKTKEEEPETEPEFNYDDVADEIDYSPEDDVGTALDPDTFRPVGELPTASNVSAEPQYSSDIQAMIDRANAQGDQENLEGDQANLAEYNERYGTNFETMDEALDDMQTSRTDPFMEEDFGEAPQPPTRVQSLRTDPIEPEAEVPEAEEEVDPLLTRLQQFGEPESVEGTEEAIQEMEEATPEEIGQSLARQQYSASDSTLARMFNAPRAGSTEASAQPEEGSSTYDNFQFGDAEPEEPAGKPLDAQSTFGEADEAIQDTADIGEDVAEDAGEIGEIGAGIEEAAETADVVAGATSEIPFLDIATGVVGGVLTLAGIGFSIYNAVEQGQQKQKTPEPNQPDPTQLAPQPGVAGHYVGASSDNYFNATQHFSGF